ncbi:uncharacterized protein LOC121736189 [Aricia agestis]|uniref:uncharacterized protein LOC121736189 n=1 Tax=Aricia agestis TaxID=91739 RepID=UPI001C2091D3|nr:uncharacterized protein LOC121736189 [Aricia agestis]
MIGLGDQRWWGFHAPRWGLPWVVYYPVVVTRTIANHIPYVPFLSQLLQLYLIYDDMSSSALGSTLTMIPISFVVFIIVASSQRKAYMVLMKQFLGSIHLNNFRNDHEHIDEILIKVEKYIRYTSYGLVVLTNLISVNWIVIPTLFNIRNIDSIINRTSEFQSIVYFYMPFDYLHDFRNWVILHAINTFMTILANSMINFFKILTYMFIFHWIGHINILKYRVQKFTVSENCGQKLVDIIKYHMFIRRVFSDIEESFGILVTVTYLHNLLGDSLLLYNFMFGQKENFLAFGPMVVLYIGDLVLLSFVLEEVRRQTIYLSDIVYDMPWQNMCLQDQKTYLIFLGRVLEPFEFISACGLRTGVRPMVSIIKSTFSYYIMLKSSMRGD